MKLIQIILFFLPFLLHSQWQETDYGFKSNTNINGEIRWLPNEKQIINVENGIYKVFDLVHGETVKSTKIGQSDTSKIIYTNDLNIYYEVEHNILNNHPHDFLQLNITEFDNGTRTNYFQDTIIFLDDNVNTLKSILLSLFNFSDSLFAINIEYEYGSAVDYFKTKSYLYNLKSNEIKSYNGMISSYNPKSNNILFYDKNWFQTYNPKQKETNYKTYTSNYKNEEPHVFSRTKDDYQKFLIMGNEGINFVLEDDNKHYFYSKVKSELVRLSHSNINPQGKWFLSDNEEYLMNLSSIENQNIVSISSFYNLFQVDEFEFNSDTPIINILFLDKHYIYARDGNNFLYKIEIPFFRSENLKANYFINDSVSYQNESVQFLDYSSGLPSKWLWYFGDGKVSAEQHPSHIYETPGLYTITLIVENEQGMRDTLIKKKAISIVPKLIADFEFEIVSENPKTINFTNKSIGEIKDYIWNFGDGTIVHDVNPTQVFNDDNKFASLTVLDEFGNFDQKVVEVNTDNNIIEDTILDVYPLPTFAALQLPTNADLTDLKFVNDKIGLIASASGEIFRTSDGGVSWNLTTKFYESNPTRIRILTSNDIIISTFSGVLYKSFDYGISWIRFSELSDKSSIVDFDCKNYDECFLISELNEINKINKRGNLESKNTFEINLGFDFIGTVKNKEPLTSILSNNETYFVATEATYYKGDYKSGYFHSLIKTNDFNKFDAMLDLDFLYGSKGNINEINLAGYNDLLFIENGKYLFTHKLGSPSIINKLIEINNFSDKFYSDSNIIILPTRSGDIYLLDSLVLDKFFPKFRVRLVNIDDSPLFGYHQISPNRGIAIGESGKYYITDFTTDVETNENTTKLDIYPNPVNNAFTIRFNKNEYIRTIEIFTTTGERVKSEQYNEYTNLINQDIENIGKGVYFLKIITNTDTYYRKIVKF